MNKETIISYESMVKLKLNDDVRDRVADAMSYLEELFDKMERIDTNGIEPLITVLDMCDVLRDDISNKFITRDELMANAPEEFDGYFQVPKTLE